MFERGAGHILIYPWNDCRIESSLGNNYDFSRSDISLKTARSRVRTCVRVESAYASTIYRRSIKTPCPAGSLVVGGSAEKKEKLNEDWATGNDEEAERETMVDTWLGSCVDTAALACLRISREDITVKVLNRIPIPRELLIARIDRAMRSNKDNRLRRGKHPINRQYPFRFGARTEVSYVTQIAVQAAIT